MRVLLRLIMVTILAFWPALAAAQWREASTDHFVIYSQESEKSLREFAGQLERFDGAMRWLLQLPDAKVGPANRLVVYAVPHVGEVRKLSGRRDSSVAGFYVPRAGASVAIVPRRMGDGSQYDLDSETILLHEYAHHFLYQNYASIAYPAWFSEGFAEFYSTAKFEKNGDVGLGLPALHRAYSLNYNRALSIEELLAPDLARIRADEREALYARGWLLTHMLMFKPGREGQLTSYMTAINSGKSGLDAATSAFGDLGQLNRDLVTYMKQRLMSYVRVPAKEIDAGTIALRALTPGENAVMALRIRSRRGVDRAAATALVPEVRRAAAPFAADAGAQAALAEAEYDAGEYAAAEAAADRAIAADPRSMDGLIYKGMAKMALAEAAETADDETWKEVRRALVAANRTDPTHPIPLMLFYQSFGAAGAPASANAVIGLNQAHMFAPQDRDLRMNVAYQYLVDGKLAAARTALAPIAFDPHAGRNGARAAAILARLDANDTAGALALWRAKPEAETEAASGAS